MRKPALLAAAILLIASANLAAQRGRGAAAPATTPKASAPVDLTGFWTPLITEDWRARMAAPRKGERPGIPLNAEGGRVVNEWDPAKDEAAGEQCRAYGAAGVMRAPGRLHITWADDTTLKVETEAGTQTRLFRFGPAGTSTGAPTWQGESAAQWEVPNGGRRGRGAPQGGNLKVVTTNMRPGYSQKNGVPYSAKAVLTEYVTRINEPDGTSLLLVTSMLDDPQYYTTTFVRSTHFKKLPDASTWEPEACSSR